MAYTPTYSKLGASGGSFVVGAYGDGKFVFMCSRPSDTRVFVSSNDGTSWTSATRPYVDGVVYGMAYGNGAFVACTAGYNFPGVIRSTNGINWTFVSASVTGASITFSNGEFLMVSYDSTTVYKSVDGISWSYVAALVSAQYNENVWQTPSATITTKSYYASVAPVIHSSIPYDYPWVRKTSPFSVLSYSYASQGNDRVILTGRDKAIAIYNTGDPFDWEEIVYSDGALSTVNGLFTWGRTAYYDGRYLTPHMQDTTSPIMLRVSTDLANGGDIDLEIPDVVYIGSFNAGCTAVVGDNAVLWYGFVPALSSNIAIFGVQGLAGEPPKTYFWENLIGTSQS